MLDSNLMEKIDQIEEISSRATGESYIESQLDNLRFKWTKLIFV